MDNVGLDTQGFYFVHFLIIALNEINELNEISEINVEFFNMCLVRKGKRLNA